MIEDDFLEDAAPLPQPKPLPVALSVPGYSVPISKLIEWLIAPNEFVSTSGVLPSAEISIELADFLLRHSKFQDYGMIHEVIRPGDPNRYFLWRKKDWQERAHVERIAKAKNDVERTRHLRNTQTRAAIFVSLCKIFPKFLTEQTLGMEMVKMWIAEYEDNPDFKAWLNRLGYFALSEEDQAAVAEVEVEAQNLESADPYESKFIDKVDPVLLKKMQDMYKKPLR